MKVVRQTKTWGLKLSDHGTGSFTLYAANQNTGEGVVALIKFYGDGTVERKPFAKDILEDNGYNPHENNNSFDNKGRIIIN